MQAPTPLRLMRHTMIAAAVVVGLAASPAGAATFSSLFVFGDSLSDAAGGNAIPLPPNQGGLPIPAPYDNGRVSNGPVAAEYLGTSLGLTSAQQFHYAIAGARTGLDGVFPSTGLLTQVGAFAMGGANPAYSGGLFMVWAGSNDVRDSLNTPDPAAKFGGIIDNLESAFGTLYALGARNFLLPNLPDLGLTPEVLVNGSSFSAYVSGLTMSFNNMLGDAYTSLALTLPEAQLTTFNTFSAHRVLAAGAPANGYLNLTNGCLVPVAGAADEQSACDVSFFVDNIHPTTSVHQVLAGQMAAAVPEPGTMLMTGAGVLALLAMGRRRQRGAV